MRKKTRGIIAISGITMLLILCIGGYFIVTNSKVRQEKQLRKVKIDNQENENKVEEKEENSLEASTEKASANEVPTIEDTLSTYKIISTLDREDHWILGKFEDTKIDVTSDDSYLSLNYYLLIESNHYGISVNDNSYRVIVHEYNQKDEYIGYVDLCNGDMINISDSVRYITISIYKYENREILKHCNQEILNDLEKGLIFSFSVIKDLEEQVMDKERLTAEAQIESLSNYYNYRKGWYKSWGGIYENTEGSICTRSFYKVDDKPYRFNVNDSRVTIEINEYDAKGKWVKYNGELSNGDIFTKQPATSYIGLTIRSRKWGVDLYTLFENGLRIDLASEQYIGKTDTINLNDADFTNTDHWKAGAYLYETGEFIIENNKICYDSFCKVGDEEYVVNLPGGYLKMSILELDQDGKVVLNNELQSGNKWKKSVKTDKIAITIYGNNKTFQVADYKAFMTDYPIFGLKEYVRYIHNTQMKDITAGEFINTVNVGWNLGNSLDSKSETSSSKTNNLKQELNWGNPYITKDLIDYVAKNGFNTIRIPVTWYYNSYKDENGYLKISEEWLNRVQEVVDDAIANHLYVILNTHHEQPMIYAGTDEDTRKQILENAHAIWTEIAEHFKNYDEHLIFESYNEVDNVEKSWNYSDKAAAQMNELNQIFVDAVRGTGENNANRILIVPTLLDGADSRFYSGFKMPRDTATDKIVVQVHLYTKKFNQDIESDFTELEEFSKKVKAPIIIGEFGTTQSYPLPELRTEQASNFVARAAEHGIKCIWWDNGSDYKIIDRRDFSASNMEMIKALLEGSMGIGYQVEQEIVLNTLEQFVYVTPNVKTGELENTGWGTLTTEIEGSAIQVQEGTTCTLSIKAINEASGIWLQRILFYDAEGAVVQDGIEIQSKYYIGTVPERAVTMRVSINSPNFNISLKDYQKYLNCGDIEVSIGCFDSKDVKEIKLTISPYE